MSASPQISVVLPVYNGEPYLRQAIDSILKQTLKDFELIIINDGSTDSSAETIRSYHDARIVFREQENKGLIATLNRGIAMARAPLIARMDQDDIALPERFAFQLSWMNQHPEVAVLGTGGVFMDESGNLMKNACTLEGDTAEIVENIVKFRKDVGIWHPTAMMRKDVVLQVGGYNERFQYAEDIELWLRISEVSKLRVEGKILLHYRMHDRSMSRATRHLQLRSGILAGVCYYLRQQGLPDPSVGSDGAWSDLNELVGGKMERIRLVEADRARGGISMALLETSGFGRYVKLLCLMFSKPEWIKGLTAKRRLKRILRESARETAERLKGKSSE